MKSKIKKIGFFIKKHIFSVICFLLATIICISGTLSYSKYITSDNTPGGASAGSFTASASINGISALSFTNTAFWGGSSENDKIAMNALRQIKFSVNNYETDSQGNKKVADVRMRYNLVFSAPVVFASKLAFQVFNEHDVALLPQIVIADLLATRSGGTYDTSTSVDYNSQSAGDLTFTVSESNTDGVKTTIAESSTGVKITITTFNRDVDQSLLFRLWDVSSLTSSTNPTVSSESGKIQPPITVNYTQTVEFYKISVTMPDFVLPAAVATTVNHSIQLAPTSAIDDNQLGGSLVNVTKDTSGNITSATPVTNIYGPNNSDSTVEGTIQTLVETIEDTNESGDTTTTQTKVTGNVQNYKENETTSSQYSYQTSKDISLTDEEKESEAGDATTTTTYVWDNYELTDKAKEYDNYLLAPDNPNATTKTYSNYRDTTQTYVDTDGTISKYVGVGTAGTYNTAFYIHKLAATQTGTKIVSTITSRQLISKTQVTNTEVTEQITCKEISGNKITLVVTKTTDTKISENRVYRTTSEETRTTVTRTGYVYRMYYLDSASSTVKCISRGGSYDSFCKAELLSGNSDKISSKDENVTYKNQVMFYETSDSLCNYFGDDNKNQYSSIGTSQNLTNTSDTLEQSTPTTKQSSEKITRVITRKYDYSTIEITEVSESGVAADGVTATKTIYKEDNPFNLFDGNIQQYYLSSSYSKNYPFYVDVIFEQVLE